MLGPLPYVELQDSLCWFPRDGWEEILVHSFSAPGWVGGDRVMSVVDKIISF